MTIPTHPPVWPAPVAAPYTYRSALDRLVEYEGLRCLWRVVAGAAWLASIPVLAIGGFIGGAYLAGDLHHVEWVAMGAIVALAPGQVVAGLIWRRRPWETLITARLSTYEQLRGPQDLNAMISRANFIPACRALRRAKLNPTGGTRMPEGPPDAPELDLKLIVGRPARWHPPDVPELYVQIRECLRAARIRARVAGEDIFP